MFYLIVWLLLSFCNCEVSWILVYQIPQKNFWPVVTDMKEERGLILFNSLCKIYVGV